MKAMRTLVFAALIGIGAVIAGGCSNSPSDEEMKQLNDLKSQVSSLEKQVSDKQQSKASLEKQLAEKNGKLKQCQDDQEAVKKGGQ
jgi:outer membrane murein-binding lipoprotein Lpp